MAGDKSPCEPLGLGTARGTAAGGLCREGACGGYCGGRTFSLHPSCWLPPSPGAARRPESPETPCAAAVPAGSWCRPAEKCPRLLWAPTSAEGAAEPMARPHAAMRFWGQEQAFLFAPCLTWSGVRAVGKTGVGVPVCPCVPTAPQLCSAVRPSPYRGHHVYGGVPLPRGCGIGHGDNVSGRLRASFPGSDRAPAAASGLALVGYFCFGSNQLCFHATFRTKSKKSTCWGIGLGWFFWFFFSP